MVAWGPLLARCGHTLYNSAWAAHAEHIEARRGVSQHLANVFPSLRNLPRNPGMPILSAHVCGFDVADAGNGRRAGFVGVLIKTKMPWRRRTRLAWLSAGRACNPQPQAPVADCCVSFSDLRPNCMRCSWASNSLEFDLSFARNSCSCCARTALSTLRGKKIQIGKRGD